MKIILSLGIIFSLNAYGGMSAKDEKSKLLEIASRFKSNSEKDKANRCQALGQFLLENKGQDEILSLKQELVRKIKSIDLVLINKLDEQTLQIYNDLFSSCRFEINTSFIGFCANCKGIERVTVPLLVVQKINDSEYLSNFIDTTGGLHMSRKFTVLQTDKPKSKQGQYSTVLLQYGSGTYRKLNGFDSKQQVSLEIGYDRTSAIFCRFNQFIGAMNLKYKGMFKCGFYVNDEDFFSSSSASLVCAPATEFNKEGKDKKKDLWIMSFDHQDCKGQ